MNRALLMLCALECVAAPIIARAQQREANNLYLSGEIDSLPLQQGGGGGVEWVHAMSTRSAMDVGGYSMFAGDQWWTFGRLGAFTKKGKRILSGTVDLGQGQQQAARSLYGRWVGSLTLPLLPYLYADAEAQYVRAAGADTGVVKVGTLYTGIRHSSTRLAYYSSSSHGTRWQYVAARGDVTAGRIGLLAGATVGNSAPSNTTEGAIALLTQTSRELFFGGSVSSQRMQMIGAIEVIQQTASHLTRLSLVLRLPLEKRPPVESETRR